MIQKSEPRIFTPEDQIWFAKQSGDWNPIHIDALAARRLLFGGPVVHGIHLVSWAVDQAMREPLAPRHITKLCVQKFEKSLLVGEPACIESIQAENETLRIVIANHHPLATVELSLASGSAASDFPQTPLEFPPAAPEIHEPETVKCAAGAVPIDAISSSFCSVYPHLYRATGGCALAFLLATTRLVGMHCPGLHSVFGGFMLDFTKICREFSMENRRLGFKVQQFDDRFAMLNLAVDGFGIQGQLRAFLRPKPVLQKTTRELQETIVPGEFTGQRLLIIGGSRGLGEVAAKLVAAGGGEAVITYHQGQADANRVLADIRSAGGWASVHPLNILGGEGQLHDILADENSKISGLLYFASPKIDLGRPGRFQPALFERYAVFYIAAFGRLTLAALPYCRPSALIYYPSTAFLDQPGSGGSEYCVAKAAGEALLNELAVSYRAFHFVSERLPRLRTDQTASLYDATPRDAADFLLVTLREHLTKEVLEEFQA